jgi:hypothetical protein
MKLVKPKKPQTPIKPSEDNKIYLYEDLFFLQRNGDYQPQEKFSSLIQSLKEDLENKDGEMVDFILPKSVSLKYPLEELAYQYNSWSNGWNMTFSRILSMDERMECYSKDLAQYNLNLTKYEEDLKKYFNDCRSVEDEEIKNKDLSEELEDDLYDNGLIDLEEENDF